ncbi:UDP-glucose dehydrogenase family protein [Campylobacter jejuni]|uniref:UDP-glucose dehydrogenase family protein n=1 Tax=Campylobacter jejuni TaxID=197 RepID=UPI000FABDE04|nr:nucleotide sugar dehydrogenase [Campylobacter jejuni]EAL0162421.1 nucleotide sugar dehydrogenase [Campylobacter jejuni]EAL8421039.1 nucleotide sugar dehydrogenase [Campylobacter jejuni]EFD5684637.1 nucleotide sugar dehydrogenase [Campylobacter jejuni]EFD8043344.1 nucleotide sugar dehydrogenase [Campylobacter jejuni]EHT9380303.1 nucleotide sugar dehydrogenase [Campylobacter jejuni]
MKSLKIAVFGLGFVGLTTAVGFAKKGFEVIGYEIDKNKASLLNNGEIPFYEEGLSEALNSVLEKQLKITNNVQEALKEARMIFYCIGTPMGEDGSADLSFLLGALKTTAENLTLCQKEPILVIKSTVPPSSCQDIFIPHLKSLGVVVGKECHIVNNPEFLREGFAYSDFMDPDRVVIGTQNGQIFKELEDLYKPFNAPVFFTSLNTGEFIKYLSNTTLSLNISYANEMSMVAQSIGDIDIINAFKILHNDKRFSGNPAGITSYLYPGMGFGGYCLPKDTLALYKKSKDKGYEAKILNDILKVNDEILDFYANKIDKEVSKEENIAILGLSFKPGSDDIRDTKSATLISKLVKLGFKNIYAYDPIANEIFAKTYDYKIHYEANLNDIINKCNVLIIATAWQEFRPSINKQNKIIYNLRWMN